MDRSPGRPAAIVVAGAALLLGLLLGGACGGGSGSEASGQESPPPVGAVSGEDLLRLQRQFLEMSRQRELVEARLEATLEEIQALRAAARSLASKEAEVLRLVNAIAGQDAPPPASLVDPLQFALQYGPIGLGALALFLLWKVRKSRLREAEPVEPALDPVREEDEPLDADDESKGAV